MKLIKCSYVSTEDQIADILTKALPKKRCSLRSMMKISLLIIGLLIVSEGDCFKIRLGENFNTLSSRKQLTIRVIDPCPITQDTVRGLKNGVNLTEEGIFNERILEVTKRMCRNIYDTRVKPAYLALDKCSSQKPRGKRDIATLISLANTVASIVVGVTNFLNGSSEESSIISKHQTMDALTQQVNATTTSSLRSPAIRFAEMERELAVVSETASHHLQLIREESEAIPVLVWISHHVVQELYAGAANLKAVKKHCLVGRVATEEIGEMLEWQSIGTILPEDTVLDSVALNETAMEFEIIYRVREPLEITRQQILIVSAGIMLTCFILQLLIVNLKVAKILHHELPMETPTSRLPTQGRFSLNF